MALSNVERQKRFRDRRKRELNDLRAGRAEPLARGKAATRARVREALANLAGQHPPETVAEYFIGTDEAILVEERLQPALNWLRDFAVAFNAASRKDEA